MDTPTLSRFFGLHFVIPFILLGLVGVHILLLHSTGSKNPLTIKSKGDKVSFLPYFWFKDVFGFLLRFIFVYGIFFIRPESLVEYQKFIQANFLVTPSHIQPEWYFLAAYAVLRAIPRKLGGVIALASFVLILYILALGSNPANSRPNRFNSLGKLLF